MEVFFFIHSRSDYSILCGPILSKLKILLDIMHVLNTYKFKMDLINTKTSKRGNIDSLDAQEQLTMSSLIRSGLISNSSKLICMSSFSASMKIICLRIAEKKWQHHFSHYKYLGISFSDAQGQLTPQSVIGSG